MLHIVRSSTGARGFSRRELLRAGALAPLGVSLADVLRMRADAGNKPALQADRTFGAAKRVLLLYLQGAASQLETWDPKPNAPSGVRGQWGAGATSVPGIHICDQLPKLSRQMSHMALVRSMSHDYNNHSNAYTLTGHPTVDFSSETNPSDHRHHPFFASVLDYLADHGNADEDVAREVPRSMGLPFRFSRFSPVFRRAGPYGAFLGAGYDPVWTEFVGKATKEVNRVSFFSRLKGVDVKDPFAGITPESRLRVSKEVRLRPAMTLERLDRRRTLAEQFDRQQRLLGESQGPRALDRFQQMALSLMSSTRLREALDIGREPMKIRERYGMTLFGQSAVTARRLLEAGAQFVSVFWDEYKVVNTAWDTHFNHFSRLGQELLPGLDAGLSALLDDLSQRGMLDDTLVLCLTEHGRTPKVKSNKKGGGRDHWSKAYSVMLAGAGIRGGSVHGASDSQAAFVASHPVTPEDILATVYHLVGVDPETTTVPDRLNRPIRLVANGKVVRELLR